MMRKSKQMSESFRIAALLSVSGGLQDVYTYISRGEVFANAQTGNIVLLSQNLFAGNLRRALHYLVPLLFFALGVAAATEVRRSFQNRPRFHWRQLVVLVEIVLLFAVGFMPTRLNLLANALVSFSCAMQVQSFRKVHSYAFASTMCIGNIRSGMEALCSYRENHNRETLFKSLHYFAIILLFGVGAGVGSVLIRKLGMHTIWVSSLLLLVSLCVMLIQEEEDKLEQEHNLKKNGESSRNC